MRERRYGGSDGEKIDGREVEVKEALAERGG